MLPHPQEEREYWEAADYVTMFDLVQQVVEGKEPSISAKEPSISAKEPSISADLRAFLMQYATTLRRNVMPDTSAKQLARKVYLEHRALFELILRSRPDYGAELKAILKKAMDQRIGWTPAGESSNHLGFVPPEWKTRDAPQTAISQTCPLVVFGLYVTGDNAYINLGLNPGTDQTIRAKIVDAVNGRPDLFNDAGHQLQDGWVRFHRTRLILDDADYDDWDKPKVRDKIMDWVSTFADHDAPGMRRVIVEFLRGYQPPETRSRTTGGENATLDT